LPGIENPPQNADGDPLLEDVDGDGELTTADAMAFSEHRNSDVVKNNPEQFDFDGDGVPGTVFDVVKLNEKIEALSK
jgi:hypothetical protein